MSKRSWVNKIVKLGCLALILGLLSGCVMTPRPPAVPMNAIAGAKHYDPHTKTLVADAFVLSKKHLDYRYGSMRPESGGMDCSGTIHYLLKEAAHIDSPRDARDLYLWLQKSGDLHHVSRAYQLSSSQFAELKPGDLLFWTGTYRTHRNPPITHVMMYLGRDKQNHPMMFGATSGTYHGRLVRGVGVFDFTLPNRYQRAHFVAYGCIPSYTCGASA